MFPVRAEVKAGGKQVEKQEDRHGPRQRSPVGAPQGGKERGFRHRNGF